MKITRAAVEHVARLSRLALDEAEIEALTGEMDAILGYVEKLDALVTDDIVPTAHAVPMENAFRPAEVRPATGLEKARRHEPAAGAGGCPPGPGRSPT